MEPIEVFQILGIEQTKDERALKNAYRDKLTVTNPEDDPEGFKRLRMAYEEACRYAGTPDAEENEEAEPTLEDDTPAGQWVRGVRKVYENITDRCDVEKWKALFEADDFLSLEEEENCTTYLLRFLMDIITCRPQSRSFWMRKSTLYRMRGPSESAFRHSL